MHRTLLVASVALCVCAGAGRAQQLLPTDGYGSLSGKVTLVGDLPPVVDLTPLMQKHADKACCLDPKTKPSEKVDLAWVVDPKTKGVANVMVWVKAPPGKYFPIHDKFKVRKESVIIDQPHCQFLPRVSAYQPFYIVDGKQVETGQKLIFKNSAAVQHNVRVIGDGMENRGFNKNLPAKTELEEKLNPQRLPLEVRCDVHTWMSGRLFVFDHPYYALTKEDGSFEIPFVPAGADIKIMSWHEGVGWVHAGASKGQPVTIEKGKKTTVNFEMKYVTN